MVDVDTEGVGGHPAQGSPVVYFSSCLVYQVPLGSPSGLVEGSHSVVVVMV